MKSDPPTEVTVGLRFRLLIPVCVEISDQAEDLRDFVHPEDPLYVFGPEDGGVPKGVRAVCHRFVRIPSWEHDERTPYNLAFAVGVVLYDRLCKRDGSPGHSPAGTLVSGYK